MAASDTSISREAPATGRGYRWLLGAVLLFLLQALPYLSYRWVTDESWYAGPAYALAHGDGVRDPGIGPNDQENHFDGRPPGTFAVMSASFRLFGTGAVTARLASVLAGVASVALVFFLTRDALGPPGAALASFLLATDNLLVLVSRNARPEALTVLAILAALLAMERYGDTRRLAWAALSGLLLAIGASFHVTLLGFAISLAVLASVLDRRSGASPLRGAAAFLIGWIAGLCPLIAWFAGSSEHRAGFREEFLGKAGTPLSIRIHSELGRYADLLGTHTLPMHALRSVPARLPIPLFLVFASYLLWRHRRDWFYVELLFLVPTMVWLTYMANKSSRYLSLLAPVFAMVMAAAVADAWQRQDRRWKLLAAVAGCVVLMQLAANLVLMRGASKADYTAVASGLRQLIPADRTAYGTITFWLGLRDGPYVAYERTTPEQAVRDFGARYFILGDPMMSNGSASDQLFYDQLNASLATVTAHSKLVGRVPSAYYGELKVYRLDDPGPFLTAAP